MLFRSRRCGDVAVVAHSFASSAAPAACADTTVSASSAAASVARHVAYNLWTAYAPTLRATCNIEKAEFLETMIQRYLVRDMPYPSFGALPSGTRFQSMNSVLKGFRVGCADAGAATENPDDGSFLDGASPEVRAQLKRRGGAYKTPVFLCQPQGGRRFRFGVDVRWLIWARAVIGTNISQTALRRVFVHLTAEYIAHRVPAQVYPYDSIITGTPDAEKKAFTVHDLKPHTPAMRTRTLVRPLPEDAARHAYYSRF